MARVLKAKTVTAAVENMVGTIVKSSSEGSKHNLQPPSKTIVYSSPNKGREKVHVITDRAFVTKSTVDAIVESGMTKMNKRLQSQISKAVKST